jgi:hypothetical protein
VSPEAAVLTEEDLDMTIRPANKQEHRVGLPGLLQGVDGVDVGPSGAALKDHVTPCRTRCSVAAPPSMRARSSRPSRSGWVRPTTGWSSACWSTAPEERMNRRPSTTDGEWVMWTPQGYYTSSPGADKIVGWQINKGAENVP